ncbi:UDP-N-acetyl-D-mannosamine 6-dehydrogenase, partial [Aureobasidium melanogenum]
MSRNNSFSTMQRNDSFDLSLTHPDHVVCVVGVGYVGEHLLRSFGTCYQSIGFDISIQRLAQLQPIFGHMPNVTLTNDESLLDRATAYLISVPTLLKADNTVDLSHLISALAMVLKHVQPGNTIVIESSVQVGTTRQILGPYQNILHCGMSPERVDPGRTFPTAQQIPKIISALTPASNSVIHKLYARVFEQVVPVSKPEVAEMTKLFENCYRMVNIAYVNEMSDAARAHGIDPNEMIDAASTKPYGYQAFRPGLGVGGHCIPVNPFYLFSNNPNLPVLKRATKLMRNRPAALAKKLHRRCAARAACPTGPRILVVGIGFKPGQSVLSYSPGLAFATELQRLGCSRLVFYDPLVEQAQVPWLEKLDHAGFHPGRLDLEFDAVAVCTRQHGVDFSVLDKLRHCRVKTFDAA